MEINLTLDLTEVILTYPYLSFLAICWGIMWIGIGIAGIGKIGSKKVTNNYFDSKDLKKAIETGNEYSVKPKATPDDIR